MRLRELFRLCRDVWHFLGGYFESFGASISSRNRVRRVIRAALATLVAFPDAIRVARFNRDLERDQRLLTDQQQLQRLDRAHRRLARHLERRASSKSLSTLRASIRTDILDRLDDQTQFLEDDPTRSPHSHGQEHSCRSTQRNRSQLH